MTPDIPDDLEDTLAEDRAGGLDELLGRAKLRQTSELIARDGIEHLLKRCPPGYAEGYVFGPTARPSGRGRRSE